MFLKKLELYCFRNYERLCFFPSSRTLIVGDNGQGKTNLLEALAVLTHGRSFRAHFPESLIQEKKKQAFVFAQVLNEKKIHHLKLSLESTGKKQFWINEKKSTSFHISQELPLILFNPESMVLLKNSAEFRRDWLDKWLGLQGYAKTVLEFKKILKQKNQLLKQIQKGTFSGRKAQVLLEGLNELFIQKSSELTTSRQESLKELEVFFNRSAELVFRGALSPGEKPFFGIRYLRQGIEGEEETEVFLKKQVQKVFFREQIAGVSLYGAHREDFKVLFQEKDSRYFCSQGQQRGLLLALKMAQVLWFHYIREKTCLLLLDDVFSEIDKQRVLNLLQFLSEIPSQVILTSVKTPSFLDRKKFQVFYLQEGILRKENFSERRPRTLSNPF